MNIDQFIAQMEADDLADSKYITPVNYAKVRPVSSPQVYQLLRKGRIARHRCACGRTVIEIEEADEYFRQRRSDWPGIPTGKELVVPEEDATPPA